MLTAEWQRKVFMITNLAEDANVVLVAFGGTESFNNYDWSMDFDFSWYELPMLVRVHVGFLEALVLLTIEIIWKLLSKCMLGSIVSRPLTKKTLCYLLLTAQKYTFHLSDP
ncbi:hypothetical protein O6H91_05G098900 [Diphasiastrum complanatum]|uniref:Uncharacterized protein n=1 Tax=Diphasiastrum complanatum TaxID=34168 RepID=A0ACC2DRM8_DIPCM|nr:hypothetical protein O6H91_05G098900 [Diphasiastrum complanatum]